MYSDKVMDHFLQPRNSCDLPDANACGEIDNPADALHQAIHDYRARSF